MFALTLSIPIKSLSAADLYVDNYLGIGGAYNSMSAAITAANPGDTIWVSGTFSESVTVNKPGLKIKRYSGATAIFDGSGTLNRGLLISGVSGLEVHGIEFHGFTEGILCLNSSNVDMHDVVVDNSGKLGMNFASSTSCSFTSCTFRNTQPAAGFGDGVYIQGSSTDNVTFSSCTFSGNARGGVGVYGNANGASEITNLTFSNCDSSNNGLDGIRLQGAHECSILDGSYDNNAKHGIDINSNCDEILIDGINATNTTTCERAIRVCNAATNIDIDNCGINGFTEDGIYCCENSSAITITGVVVTNSGKFGLTIDNCTNVTVTSCTFRESKLVLDATGNIIGGHGVRVIGDDSDNISFAMCTMTENEAYGVNVHNDVNMNDPTVVNPTTTNVTFTLCHCIANDIQGFRTQGAHGVRITGGTFNNNGASGIQIEQGQ